MERPFCFLPTDKGSGVRRSTRFLSALAIAISPIMLVAGCREVQEKDFESFAAAQKEHMVDKGWLPAFTPSDAKEIHFVGDLDAGTVYGRFVSVHRETIPTHCSAAKGGIHFPVQEPGGFPSELRHASTAEDLERQGYDVYDCASNDVMIAVQRSSNEVFYWLKRRR